MTGLESRTSIEVYESPDAFTAAMRSAAPDPATRSTGQLEAAIRRVAPRFPRLAAAP
jgi:hypothetical protein